MGKEEKSKRDEYLKGIVSNLPDSPGCYQYLNDSGVIIYVGKAKNLKRRVSSYFNKVHDSAKTNILVSNIADIKYICVNILLSAHLYVIIPPIYNVSIPKHKPSKSASFI